MVKKDENLTYINNNPLFWFNMSCIIGKIILPMLTY